MLFMVVLLSVIFFKNHLLVMFTMFVSISLRNAHHYLYLIPFHFSLLCFALTAYWLKKGHKRTRLSDLSIGLALATYIH